MMEKLQAGKSISRYPYTKGLYHKDSFNSAMKFPLQYSPNEFDFVPVTFDLSNNQDFQ